MATTTTVHAQLIRYATNGDQIIVNLKSAGSDISIDRSTNTKLPSTVSSAQTLADALGNLAFKNSLGKGDVGLGSVDNTADANKSVKYATSAGSAGSATKDSANQQISTTYIKGLSANGRTITITKGDGTTSTLTTQDTNTTYGVFAKATADAAGGTGLVPAPAKGQQGLYLRGDGSWATPTNTTYGVFKAATSSAAGGTGLVPQPAAGAQGKFLRGDGTWQTPTNTWRGVQDNLTSTATDQSLSANQGKVLKGLIDGKAASSHTHTASQITDNIPASKISGVLSLSNIPAGALERLIPVADDTARFKLTKDNAQNGDVIKVTTTGKMYFVKDDTKLSTEDGYEVFVAGTAAAVAWTNVTGRPSSMPASDVSAWAKAANKPSYSKSEVGLGNVDNTADSAKSVKYATTAGSANAVAWANVSGRPSTYAPSAHTHNYAGSSSAGGVATSANKLATARAINGVNFDGTAGITVTANPTSTDTNNGDLNSFTTPGFYYGGGSNTCKNKPTDVSAFGLIVFKTAAGYTSQLLVEGDHAAGKMWIRQYNGSAWSGWSYLYTSSYKPSKSDVGLGSVDNTADANKSVKYATSAGSASSVAWANVSGKPSSMPASDVSAWAKAASKPSYTKSEVGLGNVDNTADSAKSVKYATTAGSANAVAWGNVSGKPAITGKQTRTLTVSGPSGWKDATTDQGYVPDMAFMAYWNGAYSGSSSNLAYCNRGAFGTIVTKNAGDYAAASHSHNYAGSSSAGGAANSANKLSAARTVSGGTDITLSFNYDGSGNSNANIGYYGSYANVGDSNHYPFHRFAKLDTITASYSDKSTTFFISQDYNDGGFGIVRIVLRTNNSSSVSSVEVKWMVRCGLSADSVQVGIYNVFGKTYADAFFKTGGSYAGTYFRAIASGGRGNVSRTWVMVNSSEVSGTTTSDAKTSTECYATIAAAGTALHKQAYSTTVSGSDSGTTSYANSAGSVAWSNVSGRPSSMPASDVPAWAKAASKPSYSKSEVGLGNVDNTADSAKSVKYATTAGSANAVAWANVSGKPSTFAPSTHSHSAATTSANGFMSSTDKAKLDFGDIVYVSKTAPTKACIWVKLD